MHDRIPAAGAGDQITVDPARRPRQLSSCRVQGGHARRPQVAVAHGLDHPMACEHRDAGFPRCTRQCAARIAPGVRHQDHLATGSLPFQRRSVTAVVVRDQHKPFAGRDAIAAHIAGHGRRQHDTGEVVVREDERTFDRPGRQHDLPGTHAMQTLSQLGSRGRQPMVGATLQHRQEVVVVEADDGASRQHGDVFEGTQFAHGVGHPFRSRATVDSQRRAQQTAAKRILFVGDDDPCAGPGRHQRRRQPGWPRADDHHVAMPVHLVVAIGIRSLRHRPETRAATQDVLPEPPQHGRGHEHLVVEPRGEHASNRIDEATQTVRGRTDRDQAVVEFNLRRALIGQGAGSAADLHDGVGFLGTAANDAARPAELEAAGNHVDAIGEQGRRQRVAAQALVGPAVEREGNGRRAVDPATGGQTARLTCPGSPGRGPFHARGSPSRSPAEGSPIG